MRGVLTGARLLQHRELWGEIGGLVKDGVSFAATRGGRVGGQRRLYKGIANVRAPSDVAKAPRLTRAAYRSTTHSTTRRCRPITIG